jgi:hypothetical protein
MPTNVERLQEGGLIEGSLHEAYATVINDMSEEEIDAILGVQDPILELSRRVKAAYESSAAEGVEYRPFFVPL